jgi:O-antigen/teichoic acid export membrane protein
MSLKANLAANFASQIYTAFIGIVMMPLYLSTMGSEAYGLVGFFAMLQAWFNLLDLGLTPTIAREAARYHGQALPALDYRRVYRALSTVFVAVAVVGGAVLFLLGEVLAERWLKLERLAPGEVVLALQTMAAAVALRWLGGLYRGVISGAERLIWLGGFNALVATLRFVAVFASMAIWGHTPVVFFWHQLAVAALELAGLWWKSQPLLPPQRGLPEAVGWSLAPVRPLVKFALGIALTSSVWVLVTQSDKLLLSGILPLAEFGYFSLAVLVAGGITLLTGPISSSIMPRMARLHASQQVAAVQRVYAQATQLVAIVVGTAASTLAWCAGPLMFAWTGSGEIADRTEDVLRMYAIGNGLLALSAFPFYLQYARGTLRHHIIGNCAMGAVLIPSVLAAATANGAVGAGAAWLAVNAVYLLTWVPYSHSRLEPGLHSRWLLHDVLPAVLLVQGAAVALHLLSPGAFGNRWSAAFYTIGFALTCAAAAVLGSSEGRRMLARAAGRAV